jgi:DNA-3-methyladenine glycosylase II
MSTSFLLHPTPPFRLDYTVWALRRRSRNIIDQWDGKYYTRLFVIDDQLIKVMAE